MNPSRPDLLLTVFNAFLSKILIAKKPTQMMTKEIVFTADLFVLAYEQAEAQQMDL